MILQCACHLPDPCLFSPSELAQWFSVLITAVLVGITWRYVILTKRVAETGEGTLKLLTQREKPFICINNADFFNKTPGAHIVDIQDNRNFDMVRIDLNNGGMALAIVTDVRPSLSLQNPVNDDQKRQIDLAKTALEKSWATYTSNLYIAPGQERSYFIGIRNELIHWIDEIQFVVSYEDMGGKKFRYSYSAKYAVYRKRFMPLKELHEELKS
jgi:hypothetical protein